MSTRSSKHGCGPGPKSILRDAQPGSMSSRKKPVWQIQSAEWGRASTEFLYVTARQHSPTVASKMCVSLCAFCFVSRRQMPNPSNIRQNLGARANEPFGCSGGLIVGVRDHHHRTSGGWVSLSLQSLPVAFLSQELKRLPIDACTFAMLAGNAALCFRGLMRPASFSRTMTRRSTAMPPGSFTRFRGFSFNLVNWLKPCQGPR